MIFSSLLALMGCNRGSDLPAGFKTEKLQVRIDDAFLATNQIGPIIDPVWWTGNIYGAYVDYEASLQKFSRPQRLFYAILWYCAEINNGGHDQFFSDSTGIVWRDCIEGFELLGLKDHAAILRDAANRLGGNPPFDREERNVVMNEKKPKFGDLDDRFYALPALDESLLAYVHGNKALFHFQGEIERPVLPK